VRHEFFSVSPRPISAPPTLLVFGGSQGARPINEAVLESIGPLSKAIPNLAIIHQTGERDYESAQTVYLQSNLRAEVAPFIDSMPEAFARADLLLCRSGASTVAEIMAAGKPAVLVPFPKAADDHQMRNAEALARMNAAVIIRQAELTPETLVATVSSLLGDRARLHAMGSAARQHAHPQAARDIARIAVRVSR
jgi:UDP-N-acetylglucosamine--N-acetylmuramyl-(pentapeptide) pyrophosphoryl-undecaprenol N-acetylglucosamine transferase